MVWIIGVASCLISLYSVLTLHPFESDVANIICFTVLGVTFNILLAIANSHYEDLKSRIDALEEKLNDKEETK